MGYGIVSDDLIIVGKSKSKRVRPPSSRFPSVGEWESGLVVEFDWRIVAMTGECAVEDGVSGGERRVRRCRMCSADWSKVTAEEATISSDRAVED